jgi:biofilm protein TabA
VTKEQADARWEAHRRYIDLQYLVRGTERIGYALVERMRAEPYDEQKDVMWLSGNGDFATLTPGLLMMLWPQDAHMPGIAVGSPAPVKKVVVKIAV